MRNCEIRAREGRDAGWIGVEGGRVNVWRGGFWAGGT